MDRFKIGGMYICRDISSSSDNGKDDRAVYVSLISKAIILVLYYGRYTI